MAIDPPVGSSRPEAIRSNVDLPQPDGPTTVTNSPRSTLKVASATASVPSGNVIADVVERESCRSAGRRPDRALRRTSSLRQCTQATMSNELSIDKDVVPSGKPSLMKIVTSLEFAADEVEVALGRVRLGIDRVARAGETGLELGERLGRRRPAIE